MRSRAGAERFADRRTSRTITLAIFQSRGLVMVVEIAESLGLLRCLCVSDVLVPDALARRLPFARASPGAGAAAGAAERRFFFLGDSESADSPPRGRFRRWSFENSVCSLRMNARSEAMCRAPSRGHEADRQSLGGTIQIGKSTLILNRPAVCCVVPANRDLEGF
jgi:hypothetical protein